MKKRIIIIFCSILFISTICFIFVSKYKNNSDDLIKIIYDSSGNKKGSVFNVTLNVKDKLLVVKEKDSYNEPFLIKEYSVSLSDLKKLKNYIKQNKFPKWEKYPIDEKLFIHDGASKDITFEYYNNDYEWYKVNLNAKITFKQRKKLNEFISFFLNLAKEENLIKEYIEEQSLF